MGLEDNTKYAGEDRLLVSGNWEFADEESLAQQGWKIPRSVGVLPSKFSRLASFYKSGSSCQI